MMIKVNPVYHGGGGRTPLNHGFTAIGGDKI